jgi:polysaccharide export outer membrane protein
MALWLVAGCASSRAVPSATRASGATAQAAVGRPTTLPPAPAVSLQPPADAGDDYKLSARDQITVLVLGQKDLTRTVRLNESGSVTLPLVGDLQAAGLSAAELERRIEAKLRGGYLLNPRVTVTVVEFQGRQVAVLGSVHQPGAVTLKSNYTTMLAALSDAQGVKEGADRIAYVVRARPRPGEPQPLTVDLEALLRQGDPRYNVVVEPGDSIYVPETNTYYATGEVEKRGAFSLRRHMTLARAITEAGGVTKHAATGDIRVIRTLPTGDKQELGPFDLQAVMSGDERQDIALQGQDVVVVPDSAAKRFGYGLLDVLKTVVKFSLIAL